jgi:type III secretory pathway component EscS
MMPPSYLNEVLRALELEKSMHALKNFLSNYLWYIFLWIQVSDALVYSRVLGILLEIFKAQTSLKNLRGEQTRKLVEAVRHAIKMLYHYINLALKERLANQLHISIEELNKGYIYYTNILSKYFYEELARALQQHIVIRDYTPSEINERVKTSASRLLNETLIKQHEKLAQEKLSIVLAKLETYAPPDSKMGKR